MNHALSHNFLSVKMFLVKQKILVMEHPPYSSDLTTCDFFLFPMVKYALNGFWFKFEFIE
jgi:hypothetical protein